MCIALMKPEGVALPTDEIMERCWMKNSHGAGYAFIRDGLVHIRKGFMNDVDQVKESINTLSEDEVAGPMLIHFRIKSAGKKGPEQTHPFPMVESYDTMRQRKWTGHAAVVHNGTFFDIRPETDNESDTMRFIKEVLCKYPQWLANTHPESLELVYQVVTKNCRVGLMDKDGNMWRSGDWHEDEGIFYSNTGFEKPKPVSHTQYARSAYYGRPPVRYPSQAPKASCAGCMNGRGWHQDDAALEEYQRQTCMACVSMGDDRIMYEALSCQKCRSYKTGAEKEPCKACMSVIVGGIKSRRFQATEPFVVRAFNKANKLMEEQRKEEEEEDAQAEIRAALMPFCIGTCYTCKSLNAEFDHEPCASCQTTVDDEEYACNYVREMVHSLYCAGCGDANDNNHPSLCASCEEMAMAMQDTEQLPF